MKKRISCYLLIAFTLLSTYSVKGDTNFDIADKTISNINNGEVVKIIDLEPVNEGVNHSYSYRSVPTKVEATSTRYEVDYSNIISKSPIVDKGMTASVSYTKQLSASFNCGFSVGTDKISGAVGFSVTGSFGTSGSASKLAQRRGYLILVPRYKIVNFNVYIKPRRPGRKKKWILVSKGSAKKPENLIAIWKDA